jgi:hypothetical protein
MFVRRCRDVPDLLASDARIAVTFLNEDPLEFARRASHSTFGVVDAAR